MYNLKSISPQRSKLFLASIIRSKLCVIACLLIVINTSFKHLKNNLTQ